MLKIKNLSAGKIAGSRTALAVAVTLIVGGTATEASARSRHHHHQRHHHHMARQASEPASDSFSNGWSSNGSSWMNSNAAITPSSGTGRSFSGMASYYGNESGSRTASGQRMNASAMTCAHRSLPFGTKLRVTHGGQSVIVTVNDRGPFIRGRVLDLSTGAARAIGLTRAGVGRVTAEVVS
ncbi:septal ring lytic transglycosylase RlpA family protein [Bradyrhizobium ontarionense]|uniref:Endolytic peptidoglycan transglycosylase RlpA n=1 Tax=Bradyrhizobium ontarionense TaxID=2898149 RepID=A0ABY3R587_9BRAD|nr:septal ring lytic transglycosylase RlpA family protein [Bradyrhizobium sp. A19]UFZ01912.1 septal ring lytic transglycosylase RlpA family protein [Bradyrhizobium sp. A19]